MRLACLFACSLVLTLALVPAARAQVVSTAPVYACRDAYHEPIPCNTVVVQAAVGPSAPPVFVLPAPAPGLVAPTVVVPAPVVVSPPAEPSSVHEREGAFARYGPFVGHVDLRRLHLTPHQPERLPALSRGLLVQGEGAPSGVMAGGLSLSLGGRSGGFLRFPEIRLAAYGADLDAGSAPTASQGELSITVSSFFVLRADLGLGIEAHAGPVGFYAMARAGIAGYFADAGITHASLGDMGRAMLAEDALELGWEVAISVDLEEGLGLELSAEGMHLGAETLGGSLRISGAF